MMVKHFAGIDPGKTGAVAVIDNDANLWSIYDAGNTSFWHSDDTPALVALEKVHSMPKQGVASSFKFGEQFGWWRGWLEANGISYILVTPRRWQKAVLDGIPAKGKAKDAVWEFARRRWPDAELIGPRGRRLYGRSDALCLAEYARREALQTE